MTTAEFVSLVAEMRATQRAWFKGDKSSATLAKSKALESRVDRAVREMSFPQPSLFADEVAP